MKMSPSGYGHYEDPNRFKGPYVPVKVAKALVEALSPEGIQEEEIWALTGVEPPPTELPNGTAPPDGKRLVRVFNVEASAGHGAVVDVEKHVSNLAFSDQYLREMTNAKGNQLAAIRVRGDSMSPTIQAGDMVVIDLTKTNLDYEGLFVIRAGENLLIKRIGRGSRRTSVMVISDNSSYPPVDTECGELDVVGKVIWYGRQVQ